MKRISIIGFGEAGQSFAQSAEWQNGARVYDVKKNLAEAYAANGVVGCENSFDALDGAQQILSLVTADQALNAAKDTAKHIAAGALYFDMNSVAPDTKRSAAELIEAVGGRYVDAAIMAPVDPQSLNVPLLVSGPHAEAGRDALTSLGFKNVRTVGADIGRASTIKMLRSVMYKGVEALTAECLIACERAGVTDEVLESFGNDWASGADYRLDRMLMHGLRRSAEMYESSQTLLALGVSPMLTEGTVGWQQALGELEITPVPEGLKAKLSAILEKMP
jgi:3-hydroxyisobutyrate dehydrogenase-like beta-hydroxyacid dehydrogenase